MTNKQANILFIPTSFGGNSAEPQDAPSQHGYYQRQIYASLTRSVYTVEGFQVLGRQLAAIASHAYLARQMIAVEQATELMLALPISNQLEGIARYYRALCTWRRGDRDGARRALERVVEETTPQYRARALQIIGLTHHECGEIDVALAFYLAAGKVGANCNLLTLAESQQMTAVVRSIHGDHEHALADLERLFPVLRAIGKHYPAAYYKFLNHLAVELGEVGRLPEAESVVSIALASPFAAAYPEWRDTRDEIAAKRKSASPSVVAVHRVPEVKSISKVERAPEADLATQPESQRKLVLFRDLPFGSLASSLYFFQRSVFSVPARVTTALNAVSILDRALICIGPRAPPAHS